MTGPTGRSVAEPDRLVPDHALDPTGPAGPLPPSSVEVERVPGRLTVTWENPDPQPDDAFRLHLQADPGAVSLQPEDAIEATRTRAVVPTDGEACVTVRTVRGSRRFEPVLKCDLT
jgi:hypothetical protein